MTKLHRRVLLWSPRILGTIVALYLGVFALDSVGEGVFAFLLHVLPVVFLLLVVAVSWRREWVGGAVFIALAFLYGVPAWSRGDWLLFISGPLFIVGLLFFWSWRHHKELHAQSRSLSSHA